ncbi:2Fe-2S iron-sulfur cluster-binding protein [Kordiimonas pumila]|uniref:2Fe-2S iron-sulfur cluster-binding protein n=1 Tax=Kordiimonas pumila TaxID=2161677 RepID=A0ABV7D557_9PROT|nr:2Fe-2S iron-sulfur cluster-binding protein [Kordiimonas pumila]
MPDIIFTRADGVKETVEADIGVSIMEAGRDAGVGVEGTCGGCLSCATCHVIVADSWFTELEPMTEDEDDMLDMAEERCATSRLGCQIAMTEALDGIEITVPENF